MVVTWTSVVVEERKEVVCFRMCFHRTDGFDVGFEKGVEDG